MTCCKFDPNDVQRTQRGRALMCHMCIYAEHDSADPWGVGAVECTISGKPVNYHVISPQPTCPKGKHGSVEKPGLFRFLGVRWRGAPAPLRWLAFWRLRGKCNGCGCLHAGKRLAARIRWARRQSSRRSVHVY